MISNKIINQTCSSHYFRLVWTYFQSKNIYS